ncbi:small ribosomal subunit protein uS3m-like isoform X2 [Balearica regulorum gibbericeps]|uniref:small ribosomal subunit protein uS3m-like isoform X2 n=1 Tax=Balearica regulorum gibbericeps TaxID=100784 RepID=UPI003F5F9BD5
MGGPGRASPHPGVLLRGARCPSPVTSPGGAPRPPRPHGPPAPPHHPRLPQGNLAGEPGAAERAVEDAFLRRFLYGTFPGILADEAVPKRRANLLVVCAVLAWGLPPAKLRVLGGGYAETLLTHFYTCPVRLELQPVPAKVVYKYL